MAVSRFVSQPHQVVRIESISANILQTEISQMADEICRPTGRLALTRVGGKHQRQLDGTESAGLGRQSVTSHASSPLDGCRARISPIGAICGLASIGGVQHRTAGRGRNSSIFSRMQLNRSRGTTTSAIRKTMKRLRRATFAPILTSFSGKFTKDCRMSASGTTD